MQKAKKAKKAIAVVLVLAMAALYPVCAVYVGQRKNLAADPANGIYVSPEGNDGTATGTRDKPYRSINAALAEANPGDTVILRGGTYREGENVRIRKPNITIKSAEGEWAVIDLTEHGSGRDEDSGVYFDVDSSGGRLQGVEVMGGFYAVSVETTFRWAPWDPYTYGASDIIIEDCKLHDSKYDVVKVKPNCNNITIRNNEIYNSGRAEINNPSFQDGEVNAEGIDIVNAANVLVQNNHIHDIAGTGVYAKGGARNAVIENNRIERIYGAGIMVGFDTSPEWFDTDVNPEYYENIGGVVRNNLIMDIGWEGIGLYGSKDAQIYNNTLVNVDGGNLGVHSAIYFGLTYQDWESYAGRPANVNPSIHHNIVCQPATFKRSMVEIRYSNDLGGMSALSGRPTMHDNCYYVAGGSARFVDHRPGSVLEAGGLSAWQAHISGDAGSIEADPALDSDFMPKNPLCKGMGANNAPPPPAELDSASPWARDGIQSALAKGFVPAEIRKDYKNVITRAQFCRMAVMWLEYASGKNIDTILREKNLSRNPDAFADTKDEYILAAYALGITSGTNAPTAAAPGKFTPDGQFNREQAATMIMNTLKALGEDVGGSPDAGFSDMKEASAWAIEGINFCYANKIMVGTSASPPTFSPKATYTREQAVITFDNINLAGPPISSS